VLNRIHTLAKSHTLYRIWINYSAQLRYPPHSTFLRVVACTFASESHQYQHQHHLYTTTTTTTTMSLSPQSEAIYASVDTAFTAIQAHANANGYAFSRYLPATVPRSQLQAAIISALALNFHAKDHNQRTICWRPLSPSHHSSQPISVCHYFCTASQFPR
jgi:hypothetical protein